jgi:hypothetical protein
MSEWLALKRQEMVMLINAEALHCIAVLLKT